MKAKVFTDSRPEHAYEGQIGFISPRAEFTPKNVETAELRTSLVYRLRVAIANPDDGLRQGMPVTVAAMTDAFHFQPVRRFAADGLPLGLRQRLALACALMHEPDILFLDEPTSGVDPLTRREFWSHINSLVDKGVTVMVTTHFMEEAEYCDRIALVYRGRIIAAGSPDDLRRQVATAECPDPTMEVAD